jgi:hypothetical protein
MRRIGSGTWKWVPSRSAPLVPRLRAEVLHDVAHRRARLDARAHLAHPLLDGGDLAPAPGVRLVHVEVGAEEAAGRAGVALRADRIVRWRAGEVLALQPGADGAEHALGVLHRRLHPLHERRVAERRDRPRQIAQARALPGVHGRLIDHRAHLALRGAAALPQALLQGGAPPRQRPLDGLEASGDGARALHGGDVHQLEHHLHVLERRLDVVEVDQVILGLEVGDAIVEELERDATRDRGPAIAVAAQRREARAVAAQQLQHARGAGGGEVVPAVVNAADAGHGGLHRREAGEVGDELVGQGVDGVARRGRRHRRRTLVGFRAAVRPDRGAARRSSGSTRRRRAGAAARPGPARRRERGQRPRSPPRRRR